MTSRDDIREVIIIGSGPAGYTAALYTARAQLRPLLFGSSIFVCGSLTTTAEVENFPGFSEGVDGPVLMETMRAQAEKFGAEMIDDDILAVDLTGPVKVLTDSAAGAVHRARTVIVATGSGYSNLGLPEEELSGRGVSWCATCDGFSFRDRNIVVVGGDTAMEEAAFLTRVARSVIVVHCRSALRASKVMQNRAFADDKISFAFAFDSEVAEIKKSGGMLSGVVLRDVFTGTRRELDVTGLFIAIGHAPRTELYTGQLDLDAEGYITVAAPSTHTNLTGVFAAGAVVDHTYRQAITAALDAERYLAAQKADDTAPQPVAALS
ncbi:thioredoxin reductase [Streptomyces longisporoflavus]|uniref:NAD(P)/FAD-dependent oxidoreductase n=1 Tax=Streptomyces longisporoflavus TaxID=28044 RepID=UPI00167CB7A4|nr:FAD-dependent oxidoreductase [Streptomyces longisporoflavus]GGV73435.1 thioredoxin reductase [Streptomyces longisporoflavus]